MCDELERKIFFLIKVIKEHKISVPPYYKNPPVPPEKELIEQMVSSFYFKNIDNHNRLDKE